MSIPPAPRAVDLLTCDAEPIHIPGRIQPHGLLLALVKALADLHGGDVCAESAGPGCGSTFKVWIPLDAAAN